MSTDQKAIATATLGLAVSTLFIGQRVKHRDYKGKRVTGVVRTLTTHSEQGLMVGIVLDAPIVIPSLGPNDREVVISTQYAQAHEFTPFDERDELAVEMLQALRALRHYVTFDDEGELHLDDFQAMLARADATIAKAEGGDL